MRLRIPRAAHLPLLAAGACAALLGVLTVSADPMAEWIHGSYRADAGTEAQQALVSDTPVESNNPAAPSRRKGKCSECGIIESARLTEGGGSRAVYEITVRLSDRSTRVFSDSDAAKWRPGERIILIGGGIPPSN
jgi:hypothetical protein